MGTPENKRDRTKNQVQCAKSQLGRDNDKLKSIFTEHRFEMASVLRMQTAVLTRTAGTRVGLQSPGTFPVGPAGTNARLRPRGTSQYRPTWHISVLQPCGTSQYCQHGAHLGTAMFNGPD